MTDFRFFASPDSSSPPTPVKASRATGRVDDASTSRLRGLFDQHGQSAWLDNLTRSYLQDGTLVRLTDHGVRGVTANPTIVARAIESSAAYDEQLHGLVSAGWTVEEAYWQLVITDVIGALRFLRPTFDANDGDDGFVSIEVSPECANDTPATIAAARDLHERIREPNLMVKIPATTEGVAAIEAMIGEGRSINVTLLFSLARYAEVLEAYLSGLEKLARRGGDLSKVHSVASFFVSRVDTEVDRRLEESDVADAASPRGRGGVAQAKLAYQLFRSAHTGDRWDRLSQQGARVQRPLWASTSTKNRLYSDTLYVDNLIGPETVNTLSESTMDAFEDHGTLARTVDTDIAEAVATLDALAGAGIDLDDVGRTLESQGIEAFRTSYTHVLDTLRAKAKTFSGG
jgi:transaldolase